MLQWCEYHGIISAIIMKWYNDVMLWTNYNNMELQNDDVMLQKWNAIKRYYGKHAYAIMKQ